MRDKFCKDCKFVALDDHSDQLVCNHELNFVEYFDQASYLATGIKENPRMVRRGSTATSLRSDRGGAINLTICGPDANWYIEKGL